MTEKKINIIKVIKPMKLTNKFNFEFNPIEFYIYF